MSEKVAVGEDEDEQEHEPEHEIKQTDWDGVVI